MKLIKRFTSALLLLGISLTASGAHHETSEELSFFHKTFLGSYSSETDKLISLAEAFSEEGFEWRPADGIRSVRESILHVAAANYFFGSRLGKAMPEGLNPRGFEKEITDREEAIATLKASIAFAKEAIRGVSEESMSDEMELFGNKFSKMGLIMLIGGHAYEHLGQLIAYARSSGVTPPWSES